MMYKLILFALAFILSCSSGDSGSGDGNYNSKQIGAQVWMAENLNSAASGSKCYDNQESNCAIYGRLYDWAAAKSACPKGWHIPNNEEWDALMTAAGGAETAGKYLKAKSGWNEDGNGTDEFGFSALPGGWGNSEGGFSNVGSYGLWWSASEHNADSAYIRIMRNNFDNSDPGKSGKSSFFSVRCLKN